MVRRGPMGGASLETVFLYVKDIQKMRRFYHTTLGLPIVHENPHFVQLRTEGALLALHTGRKAARPRETHWFMEFLVKDITKVARSLRRRGVRCSQIRREPFGRVASFLDPEGNRIGLEEPSAR